MAALQTALRPAALGRRALGLRVVAPAAVAAGENAAAVAARQRHQEAAMAMAAMQGSGDGRARAPVVATVALLPAPRLLLTAGLAPAAGRMQRRHASGDELNH